MKRRGILAFIDDDSKGGCYVLRIRVKKRMSIACGRFDRGRPITFLPGEYLYVGSAMSELGATCLARRLVRHATRLSDHPPHPIRQMMLEEFPKREMTQCEIVPGKPKRPKWNVDHVLDQTCVTLTGAYVVRTKLNLEAALGKFLEKNRATVVFKPGLGANDIKGNTHLLRVDAGEEWWHELPKKLKAFALLSNKRPARSHAVLQLIANGISISRAEIETQGISDTWNWGEGHQSPGPRTRLGDARFRLLSWSR